MCTGGPSMPKAPEPPPPAPMAPPPAPMIEPEAPTPPPTNTSQGETDAAKIKKRTTKRQQQQQASSGANALRIPLNTGGGAPGGKKTGSLNIPT